MYLEYYHLKKKPFGLSPGPEFFWHSEKHEEALATLRYGVMGDLGFLLLTGEVGVGKTALIHRMLTTLDSSTIVARITDPGLSINDFFRLLSAEFGIDTPFTSKGEFLITLERFLRQADNDGKRVLLIVDEAQRIKNALLDQIRVLSNIELDDRKLINIFFVGQPEFNNTLLEPANRALRQRIAIYYHVPPLTEEETGQYIEHRLEVAGARQKIFKTDAIREIHRATKGFPRGINILCDHSLLTGFASDSKTINSKIVQECGVELNIAARSSFPPPTSKPTIPTRPKRKPTPEPSPAPTPSAQPSRRSSIWVYLSAIFIGTTVVAVAGYYFLSLDTGGLWPIKKTTEPSSSSQAIVRKVDNPPQTAEETESPATEPIDDDDTNTGTMLAGTETSPSTNIAETAEIDGATESGSAIEPPSSPSEDDALANQIPPISPKQNVLFGQSSDTPTQKPDLPIIAQPVEIPDAPAVGDTAAPSITTEPSSSPDTNSRINDLAALSDKQPTPEPAPPSVAQLKQEKADEAPKLVTAKPTTAAPTPAAVAKPQTGDLATDSQPQTPPDATPAVDTTPKRQEAAPKTKPEVASKPVAPVPAPPTVTTPAKKDLSVITAPQPVSGLTPPVNATPKLQATATEPNAVEKPVAAESMESRLNAFLQNYCSTYSSKDLEAFQQFFAPDAVENGKSIHKLWSKYQRNFTFIDTIYYKIELDRVTRENDGNMLEVNGSFFLRWLPPDKEWRENTGKITIALEEKGTSFLVHRLDYQGNKGKN